MDMSRLAAKQQRLKYWRKIQEDTEQVQSPELADKFRSKISSYMEIINSWWSKQSISEVEQADLTSLERELEELCEVARMTVIPYSGVKVC